MSRIDSVSSQSNADRLTPEQRREFLKAAKESAKERVTPEERRAILKDALASKAKDEEMVKNISRMIKEEVSKPDREITGQFSLRPDDFEEREKSGVYQTRAKDVTQAIEILKNPERARDEYEKVKVNEALSGAFGSAEATVEGLPETSETPAPSEEGGTGMFRIADLESVARKKKKMN